MKLAICVLFLLIILAKLVPLTHGFINNFLPKSLVDITYPSFFKGVLINNKPNSIDKTPGLDTDLVTFGKSRSGGLLIFPGTKWCGDGNKAKDYDDLGIFESLDKCCRTHDHCPDSIPGGETKYGLTNNRLISRFLCACDLEFYDCLRQENSIVSRKIGFLYFTVLSRPCFKKEHKKIACEYYEMRKCTSYKLDLNSNKTYQWFDTPAFIL